MDMHDHTEERRKINSEGGVEGETGLDNKGLPLECRRTLGFVHMVRIEWTTAHKLMDRDHRYGRMIRTDPGLVGSFLSLCFQVPPFLQGEREMAGMIKVSHCE